MLESIHIENIALIKKLDISFSKGFSAFTGETGAGKSIIVDSIGAICGSRLNKELIRSGADYALTEAMFTDITAQTLERCQELGVSPDEDGCLFISRKITSDGKSVCRINSKQVPSSLLKELSSFLVNIHGQHDNQDLLKKEKHISILDAYDGSESLRDNYLEIYNNYKSLKHEKELLVQDELEKQRTIEMLKFQIEEISSLKLKNGEEEELAAEKKKLANIEKITENASNAYGALFADNSSAIENVDRALSHLSTLAKISDGMDNLLERLENARAEIYDVAEILHDIEGESEDNPSAKLDRIEKRLYDIYKLKRKYGPDIPTILEYLNKIQSRLSELEFSEIREKELESKLSEASKLLKESAYKLSDKRKVAAEKLQTEIENELKFLEMEKVRFKVSITENEFSSDGCDDVEFLVQTNVGLPFSPLAKTASGGELSRIMLAIKSVIAKKDGVETLIFDEVDTGISGKTSRRIGIKLLQTSRFSQVMCVTHSAQIASLADSHYLVSKAEENMTTITSVKLLKNDDRVAETARIISGINITDSAKKAALELIEESKKY